MGHCDSSDDGDDSHRQVYLPRDTNAVEEEHGPGENNIGLF